MLRSGSQDALPPIYPGWQPVSGDSALVSGGAGPLDIGAGHLLPDAAFSGGAVLLVMAFVLLEDALCPVLLRPFPWVSLYDL